MSTQLSKKEREDFILSTGKKPPTEYDLDCRACDHMIHVAKEAGMVDEVVMAYSEYLVYGKTMEEAAYYALAEWDLTTIPNLNSNSYNQWSAECGY